MGSSNSRQEKKASQSTLVQPTSRLPTYQQSFGSSSSRERPLPPNDKFVSIEQLNHVIYRQQQSGNVRPSSEVPTIHQGYDTSIGNPPTRFARSDATTIQINQSQQQSGAKINRIQTPPPNRKLPSIENPPIRFVGSDATTNQNKQSEAKINRIQTPPPNRKLPSFGNPPIRFVGSDATINQNKQSGAKINRIQTPPPHRKLPGAQFVGNQESMKTRNLRFTSDSTGKNEEHEKNIKEIEKLRKEIEKLKKKEEMMEKKETNVEIADTKRGEENEVVSENTLTSKHEIFLKKLIGTFSNNCLMKVRGYYCLACNEYLLFTKQKKSCHDDSEKHRNNVQLNPRIKRRICFTCKALFYCDQSNWIEHLGMELHSFMLDKSNNTSGCSEQDRQTGSGLDSEKSSKIPLTLKSEIKENFLKRLLDTEGGYSFYCHSCTAWFESNEEWVKHNDRHKDDQRMVKETMKHCKTCKVMIIGSNELKNFHGGYAEHSKFKEFLTADLEGTKEDASDKNNHIRPKPGVNSLLLIKDLPENVSREDVFNYFKDFGRIDNLKMHFCERNSALISFKFRGIPFNIVNSGVPIVIKGKKVSVQLQVN